MQVWNCSNFAIYLLSILSFKYIFLSSWDQIWNIFFVFSNPWLEEFWEWRFNCHLRPTNSSQTPCSGVKLTDLFAILSNWLNRSNCSISNIVLTFFLKGNEHLSTNYKQDHNWKWDFLPSLTLIPQFVTQNILRKKQDLNYSRVENSC